MNPRITATLFATVLLAACSTPEPKVQTGPDAEVVLGNLHRVDNTRGLVYRDPKADFSRYTSFMIDPLDVDNVQIAQPQRSAANRRNDWTLNDKNKESLRTAYMEVFTREIQETGDYPIVTEPGPDVLRISASLTAIAPNAGKDDFQSRPAGRSRVYTEGSGSMSMAFAFSDSSSGEILGIIKDTRSGSPMWGSNNSVSNMSDVRFMLNSWARALRARLDIIHGY